MDGICEREEPPLRDFGEGHRIRCHLPPDELRAIEPVITLAPAMARR